MSALLRRSPLAASGFLLASGALAHAAVLICVARLPGSVADATPGRWLSALATGLAWAAAGVCLRGRGALATRVLGHGVGSLLTLALVFAEARYAVLGVAPRLEDLFFFRHAAALAPSLRPLVLPLAGAAALGLLLWNLALWRCVRAGRGGWSVRRQALLSTALALGSLALGLASGHTLSGLAGRVAAAQQEDWRTLPQELAAEDLGGVFAQLGLPTPRWPSSAPLCRPQAPAPPAPGSPPRSAIVLILEGLGTEVLGRQREGRWVTPFLHDLSERHPTLRRVVAAGTKTAEGLIALLSGVPAVPGKRLSHLTPLPRFEAVPGRWSTAGYSTALLLAADPTFDQVDRLAAQIGVQQVRGRRLEDEVAPVGWGVDDPTLLRRARDWVDAARQDDPQPFVLFVNSVGTHHPYLLPPEQPRRFAGDGADVMEDELFARLDTALADFVAWFDAAERARGTLLLITGDHVSHRVNARRSQARSAPDFATPLVLLNLRPEEGARLTALREALTAQVDLGPTLSHLLGAAAPACTLGVDLLLPGAVEGRQLVVGHDPEQHTSVLFCDQRRLVSRLEGDRYTRPVLEAPEPDDACAWRASLFYGPYVQLLASIADLGAFGPVGPPRPAAAPGMPEDGALTVMAAHRGAVDGALAPSLQNRSARIAPVRAAGFEWFEVDVSLTRDGIPVVFHDPAVAIAGRQVPVSELDLASLDAAVPGGVETFEAFLARAEDLNLIIDLKPPPLIEKSLNLVYRVAQALRQRPAPRRVIVDSFSPAIANAAAKLPGWEAGWDTPFKTPISAQVLQYAGMMGVRWLLVHKEVLTADVVQRARRAGLRILAYPIDAADEDLVRRALPDGLIADTAEVLQWRHPDAPAAPAP